MSTENTQYIEQAKLSKADKKAFLKENLNQTIKIGTYSLTIVKVANVNVKFEEHINGLQHTHNWFNIEDAYDYYFHKVHLNEELASYRKALDFENASPAYKNQVQSYENLMTELKLFLYDYIDQSTENPFDSIEPRTANVLRLNWQNGQKLDIVITSEEYATVDIKSFSNIVSDFSSAVVFSTAGKLLTTIYGTCGDIESSNELKMLLARYQVMTKQLDKFQVLTNTEIEFPLKEDQIIDFVRTASDGDILEIPLTAYNNRTRVLEIERKSRIKYLVEVRNYINKPTEAGTTETIMQEEYWTNILKFSSNFSGNITTIKKIYNALY